ncbi:MAG: hypothetical protein PHW74_10150 [Desulfobacca sp.]|nr:hypothetical protein [Desulfobacca sp.]
MQYWRILTVWGMLLTFIICWSVGCGDKPEPAQKEPSVTGQDVKEKAKSALDTAAAYLQQQKEQYQKQINDKLQDLDKNTADLKAKLETLTADAKAKFQEQLDNLQQQKQDIQKKLDELQTQGGQAWESAKPELESAMKELNQAYDKAREDLAKSKGE